MGVEILPMSTQNDILLSCMHDRVLFEQRSTIDLILFSVWMHWIN